MYRGLAHATAEGGDLARPLLDEKATTCANEDNDDDDDDNNDCDGRPAIASACPECGVTQNVGLDDIRVPSDLTKKMRQVVHDSNEYHRHVVVGGGDTNLLVREACQNRHELCSFWKIQNRCDESSEYYEFLFRECPLACQLCHLDKFRARQFLHLLWERLPNEYYKGNNSEEFTRTDVVAARSQTLGIVMSAFGMDPSLLHRPLRLDDGNWAQELHGKLTAVIPSSLLRLYSSTDETSEEKGDFMFLRELFDTSVPELVPYRYRGYVVASMLDLDHFLTRPIQLSIGFAVPNEAALVELDFLAMESKKHVLQMGAGTGYWTSLLRQRGIDVAAYDLHPPARQDNAFFEGDFSNDSIEAGACVDVISNNPDLARSSILLMVWPNDPDPIDNPQFCEDDYSEGASQAAWDTECLRAYVQSGGSTVVYIGEREDTLSRITDPRLSTQSDSGLSATRAFQEMLKSHFELVKIVPIPQWWLNEDDMTIWRKQQGMTKEPLS